MFIIIANKKESPNPVAMWKSIQIKRKKTLFYYYYYILLPHRFITKMK